nr:MAG TPA: hypothetical protein [Caudoviricetes sp.]
MIQLYFFSHARITLLSACLTYIEPSHKFHAT